MPRVRWRPRRPPRLSRRAGLMALAAGKLVGGAAALVAWRGFGTEIGLPFGEGRRRRRERRPRDLARAWAEKMRDLTLRRLRPRNRVTLLSGAEVSFELRSVDLHHFPG